MEERVAMTRFSILFTTVLRRQSFFSFIFLRNRLIPLFIFYLLLFRVVCHQNQL